MKNEWKPTPPTQFGKDWEKIIISELSKSLPLSNEWTPAPPTYKFTQPEGERELNDWMKGLGWGIVVGIAATNIIYLLILNL